MADQAASEAGQTPSLAGPFWQVDLALIVFGAIVLVVSEGIFTRALPAGNFALSKASIYAILVGSSSVVVAGGLRHFTGDALQAGGDIDEDTGWLIGKLENILVLTFVFQGAFTALSIVFAAKSFIRREDTTSGNSTYYVAGTLLNFTYSILVGLIAVGLLEL